MTGQAATIMFQGTSSDVGKSLLTAALCRILARNGVKVAPFKSQNMSLNSYVTPDGKEIGRAQGMQADACGIAATTDMNPILLKPTKDMTAQIVVHGKPYTDMDARAYREQYLPHAEKIVKQALSRLRTEYDVVVIEGAGSPAEINLKDRDIVNMRLAGWADAPVILVADIDRGGVFASIVGTLEILEPHERDRIRGIIINKFRGDVTLLQPGIDWLEARIGKPVLGVLPYIHDLALEDEDSASLDRKISSSTTRVSSHSASGDESIPKSESSLVDIAVIRLPRISNFTDLDPLLQEADIRIRYVASERDFGTPDAVILPGSKNTIEDLLFLRECGLADRLLEYASKGGRIIGICGGYQMLGERLRDPAHIESDHDEMEGLGLFPMETVFAPDKKTERVTGYTDPSFRDTQTAISGYEIHMGQTAFSRPVKQPFHIRLHRSPDLPNYYHSDGAMSPEGRIWGTYIHGILHNDELRTAWLNDIRIEMGLQPQTQPTLFGTLREQSFERLADHFARHVDIERIYKILGRRI